MKTILYKKNSIKLIKQKPSKSPFNKGDLYLDKAQKWAKILGKCPGVMAIFLSGSIPQGKATDQSDIDFFIIAREGQIWTARFFVFLVLKLCQQIATESDHAGKICPNHFIKIQEQDKYAANLFSHNIPLYDPYNLWSEFVKANEEWIGEFGYKFFKFVQGNPSALGASPLKKGERILKSPLRGGFRGPWEQTLKSIQTKKIKNNPDYKLPGAKIVLEDHELRLHPKPKNKDFKK